MVSQKEILLEFYKKNPNRNISHPEIVDWSTKEYHKTGKKMFIRLYELSKKEKIEKEKAEKINLFCKDILAVFEKHNINGHIKWQK